MSALNLHKAYMVSVEESDINDADKVVVDVVDKKEGQGNDSTPPSVGDTGEIDKIFDKQDIKSLDNFVKDAEESGEALLESVNDINDFERALERIAAYQSVGAWSTEEAETKLNEMIYAACPFEMEDFSLEASEDDEVKKGIFKNLGEKIANTSKVSSFRRQLESWSVGYTKLDIYGEFKSAIDEAYKDAELMTKASIRFPNTKFGANVKHLDIVAKELDTYQKTIFSIILKAFEDIMKAESEEDIITITKRARDEGYNAVNNLTIIDFTMVERTWMNKVFKTKTAQEIWWKNNALWKAFIATYESEVNKEVLLKDVIKSPSDMSVLAKTSLAKLENALAAKSTNIVKGTIAIDGSIVAAKSKLKGDKLASFKLKNAVSVAKNLVSTISSISAFTEGFCGEIIYGAQQALLNIAEAKLTTLNPKVVKAFEAVSKLFITVGKYPINNKMGTSTASAKFEVKLDNKNEGDEIVVKSFISMENAPGVASGSDKATEIQNPSESLLDKLISNANNNDQLDAKSKSDIVKELKGAGYEIDDNGGEYADELEPKAIKELSDQAITKVDKLSTEEVMDIELESADFELEVSEEGSTAAAIKRRFSAEGKDLKAKYKEAVTAAKDTAKKKNDALNEKLAKDLEALKAKKSEMDPKEYRKKVNELNEASVEPFNDILKAFVAAKKEALIKYQQAQVAQKNNK